MIPWIQIYSNLTTHPKTMRLAEELKLSSSQTSPNIIAAGMLVAIWTWAIQNAYDGDLAKCSPSVIADACRWRKKPEQLIAALKAAGYVDEDMHLHDWDDYTILYIELQDDAKLKHRERQRKYREAKKSRDGASHSDDDVAKTDVTKMSHSDANTNHRDVTVTSRGDGCDALPNLTIPNHTIGDTDDYIFNNNNIYNTSESPKEVRDTEITEVFEKYAKGDKELLEDLTDYAEARIRAKNPLSLQGARDLVLRLTLAADGSREKKLGLIQQAIDRAVHPPDK